jgi:hypothetical protein
VSELEEALSDVRRRLEYGLQSAGLDIHVSASLGVIDAALAKARNEQVKQIAENANCSSPVERPSQHGGSNDE